ncbi:hypothetical protein ACN38_g11150, partial [Penicillium nordicum]
AVCCVGVGETRLGRQLYC